MDNINDIINKLYGKKINIIKRGFFKNYAADLLIAIAIIYVFLLAIMYFYILNHIPNIRANWSTEKCNPLYIPFAGLIINDPNKSNLNMISENFTDCINNMLTILASYAFSPVYYTLSIMSGVMQLINESINSIRAFFNKIRNSIKDIASNVSDRTFSISIPIMKFFIVIKDTMSKAMGLFTAALYTFFAQFLMLKALIGSITEIGISVLLLGLIIIAALWASTLIPFVGFLSIPVAIGAQISYVVILTILILVMIIGSEAFSIANRHGKWEKAPHH